MTKNGFKNIIIVILLITSIWFILKDKYKNPMEYVISGDKQESQLETNYYFYPYDVDDYKELKQCLRLTSAMQKIASEEYIKDGEHEYDCKHFSKDLKEELARHNIKGELITGKWDGGSHMWVGIWIEATSGKFVRPDQDYVENPYELIENKKGEYIIEIEPN